MESLLTLLVFIAIVGLAVMVGLLYQTLQQEQRGNLNRETRPATPPPVPTTPPSARPNPSASSAQQQVYRTRDGAHYFRFSFEQERGGNWRVYIVEQPSYGRREDDAHTTHRLSDGARRYVCWTDPLRTLEQGKQVALMWAEATQKYIRSGTRF